MSVRVIADEKIPGLAARLAARTDLRSIPADAIDRVALADADALVVRTVTRVDERLVRATPVRFVATASAGVDHVDVGALTRAGIRVVSAPGCNAPAVAHYVDCALVIARARGIIAPRARVGIVGLGHTGSALARRLVAQGIPIAAHDPPLLAARAAVQPAGAAAGAGWPSDDVFAAVEWLDRDALLGECDAISLHVPWIRGGPSPTERWIDQTALRAGPSLFINASRGGILDEHALAAARPGVRAVIDTWEAEPDLHPRWAGGAVPELRERVALASPHIAGYSQRAKDLATERVATALLQYFALDASPAAPSVAPGSEPRPRSLTLEVARQDDEATVVRRALEHTLDLVALDDALWRTQASVAPLARRAAFTALRDATPLRAEPGEIAVVLDDSYAHLRPQDWPVRVAKALAGHGFGGGSVAARAGAER